MTEATPTWPSIFSTLTQAGAELSPAAVSWAMTEILEDRASEAQIAAFILGLKIRGESPEVVAALAQVMMTYANIVPVSHGHEIVLDIVGTGGDGLHEVNISTMAAVVAAACGSTVIKHGNRAVSSLTGAADLLEEMGVNIDLDAQGVSEVAREVGISFCFAPRHHPAMRFAAPARKQVGIPTVFNILGPLTNPAQAQAGLIGCARVEMAQVMAQVLLDRGVKALVVRGNDGCDEISLADSTRVWDITTGVLQETLISPRDFGVNNFDSKLLRGGDRRRNAELTRKVLGGEPADESPANNSRADSDAEQVAAIRLSVAVNAAAALVAADAVSNPHYAQNTPLVDRINRFLPDTTKVLAGSAAWNLMLRWIEASRDVASRS